MSSAKKRVTRKPRVKRVKRILSPTEQIKAAKAKDSRLRKIFNICNEEYDAVLAAQGGVCRITGKSDNLALDHDHKTGKLRGIIHVWVNKGLKYFQDNPTLLRLAAHHLENSSFTETLGEDVYGIVGSVGKKLTKAQKKTGQTAIAWKYGPHGTADPQIRTSKLYRAKPTRATKTKKA